MGDLYALHNINYITVSRTLVEYKISKLAFAISELLIHRNHVLLINNTYTKEYFKKLYI